MPKIDLSKAHIRKGSGYPAPYNEPVAARLKQTVGDAGGLSDFGVNLTRLPPGTWSAQRHWHSQEDEFVFVVDGELVLVTNDGEEMLRAGECAAFPKGVANGHRLENRTQQTVTYLEVGTRAAGDVCSYPDIDLLLVRDDGRFSHKDGTPY